MKYIVTLILACLSLTSYSDVSISGKASFNTVIIKTGNTYQHTDSEVPGSSYFHNIDSGLEGDENDNDRIRLWLKKDSNTEEIVTKIKVFNF